MCSLSSCLNFVSSAPQARSTSRTFGVSRIASSRCSTVRYSCRASRAWVKALLRQYSSSLDSTSAGSFRRLEYGHGHYVPRAFARPSGFLQRTHERVLVIPRVGGHLGHLSFGILVRKDPAHALT